MNYRTRIIELARNEVGKRGPYAHGGLWCGAFVCWVLNQAGLVVRAPDVRPGEWLCKQLPRAHDVIMVRGDIIRHPNGHCGIIDFDGVIAGSYETVHVTPHWRGGTRYSVDELIRCALMTGAETGEVF